MPIDPNDPNQKTMAQKLGLDNNDDQSQLNGYTQYLDTDHRAAVRDMLAKQQADQGRAVQIAERGVFQDKTPEEQDFVNKQLSPGMQGLIGGGGVMGGVKSVEQALAPAIEEGVAATAPTAIEKFQQMKDLLARGGGYMQRLGAEAKGAAGLSAEAGNTLTGVTGGSMQDAAIKQQLANKLRGL